MALPTEPSPLETKLSTQELIYRIHRKLNELEHSMHEFHALLDTAFPGADLNRHRTDHEEIHEKNIERRRLWSNLRSQALAGVMMFAASAVIGLIVFSVTSYLKHGGG